MELIIMPNNDYQAELIANKTLFNRVKLLKYRLLFKGKRVRGNSIERVVYEVRSNGSLWTDNSEALTVLNQVG